MKREDLQKVILSKYQNADRTTKIYRHLNGGIGLRAINQWCQMTRRFGLESSMVQIFILELDPTDDFFKPEFHSTPCTLT